MSSYRRRKKTNRYASAVRKHNATVKRVVEACKPVLHEKFGIGYRLGCGLQGCVYRAVTGPRLAGGTVIKVSSGQREEVDQVLWRRKQGWRSHASLPRFRRIYKLGKCAAKVGAHDAYVTEREDLLDVPATRHTRRAVTLLEDLESRLFKRPGSVRNAHATLMGWLRDHESELRRFHETDILAFRICTHIAHLQRWLAEHGLTMSDIRLSNLGIRKHGIIDRYDIVMRDMGFLTLRSSASKRQRAAYQRVHQRAPSLGATMETP